MQSAAARQQRRAGATTTTRQQRSSSLAGSSTSVPAATAKERKVSSTKIPSSLSRPATPNPPTTAPAGKTNKQKETPAIVPPARTPSPAQLEIEAPAAPEDASQASSPPESELLSPEPVTTLPAAPPGLPAVPPGLSAPPGLPPPSHTPLSTDSSPQISTQMPQGPYQMSTAAHALLEDLKARREGTTASTGPSPFPELDRMMQSLAGDNSFSFNLDPKLAVDTEDIGLPDFEAEAAKPFTGTFFDAFPGVRQPPPPGLGFPHLSGSRDRIGTPSSSYSGSFNPFAADLTDESPSQFSPLEEERKVSRFGFARGRQGSAASTSASSPLHASTSISHSESFSQSAYFTPSELLSSTSHASPSQWNYATRHHEYLHQPTSAMSSPLAQHAQAHSPYEQQQQHAVRYQQYDTAVSEAQLREFINSSRDRSMRPGSAGKRHTYTKTLGLNLLSAQIRTASSMAPTSRSTTQPLCPRDLLLLWLRCQYTRVATPMSRHLWRPISNSNRWRMGRRLVLHILQV
jgi:CCR4-NOT transcription complex subunit 4